MKKILIILLTLLLTLTISGCGESVEASRFPEILMIKVHQNSAWGRYQRITVIDRDGKCRSQSVGSDNGEKPEGWIEFSKAEDGWYDALLEIAENGEQDGDISGERLSFIRENARSFAKWSDLPETVYGGYGKDIGKTALYGVYLDDNGEPRLAELAAAGVLPYCKSSARVRKFVNRVKLLDYKFA